MNLDAEEMELEEHFEPQKPAQASSKKEWVALAKANLRKDHRINIRLPERDLIAIQTKALQEGLPYQTLISSVIHKYVSGSLTDKRRV